MLLREYDLFVFDWDGTLSTSTFLVRFSNLLRRRYRLGHIRRHKREYTDSSIADIRITEERNRIFALLYDLYSSVFMPRLKDGALEMLKALRTRGKKVAIFSDSESYRLMVEVKKLNVLDYVDFVLGASSINSYKPDPAGIMLIAERYKTEKKRVVYVGDMPSDVMTARFAGVGSCALADGLAPYGMLSEVEPDHIFRNIQAMLREISY